MSDFPQKPLDLRVHPARGRSDFIVSESNRAAVALVDRWPDWPTFGTVLWGPPDSGKSHLVAVMMQKVSGAVCLEAADLGEEEPSEAPLVVVENVDRGVGREKSLLHLYNAISERGGHLFLTGRSAPTLWDIALPDLSSRLRGVPAVRIEPPDDMLLGGVLAKMFADRQVTVDERVVRYILRRTNRSFAAVRETVAALDRASLSAQRRVTVPFVRDVLGWGDQDV